MEMIDTELVSLLQELAEQEGETFKICANPDCKLPFVTNLTYQEDLCISCSGIRKSM